MMGQIAGTRAPRHGAGTLGAAADFALGIVAGWQDGKSKKDIQAALAELKEADQHNGAVLEQARAALKELSAAQKGAEAARAAAEKAQVEYRAEHERLTRDIAERQKKLEAERQALANADAAWRAKAEATSLDLVARESAVAKRENDAAAAADKAGAAQIRADEAMRKAAALEAEYREKLAELAKIVTREAGR